MAQGISSALNGADIDMDSLTLASPAKINLMLSVHGQRGDGFHELTSLVAPLDFGDTLKVSVASGASHSLVCGDLAVPTGDGNLIIQAAKVFQTRLGEAVYFDFDLVKRIPMGAGLGGGSSNAAVALRGMNELTGSQLDREALLDLAAELGSDCPLFIDSTPMVMSGRGEVLEALPSEVVERLRGQRIVLFKPDFGVNTGWAYRQLIESNPSAYEAEKVARRRIEDFTSGGALETLLYNTFEANVGKKYLAIPCLLELLRSEGYPCLMSGSGSCCLALAKDDKESLAIREICLNTLGTAMFFVESAIS